MFHPFCLNFKPSTTNGSLEMGVRVNTWTLLSINQDFGQPRQCMVKTFSTTKTLSGTKIANCAEVLLIRCCQLFASQRISETMLKISLRLLRLTSQIVVKPLATNGFTDSFFSDFDLATNQRNTSMVTLIRIFLILTESRNRFRCFAN